MGFRNLIPIPRRDKNGRITIRHMREHTPESKEAKALPPVTITTQPEPIAEDDAVLTERATTIHDAVLDATGLNYLELLGFKAKFIATAKEYPRLANTIERTLTTGAKPARAAAWKVTHVCFGINNQTGFGSHDSFEDTFSSRLLERWNALNVGEETGLSHTMDLNTPSRIISFGNDSNTHGFTDSAWRGFAALRLALEVPGGADLAPNINIISFIHWAGKRDDLREVIRIVRERGVVDPKTLEGLLAAAPSTAPAIRDGLL